jgi:hypothetical protein
MTDRIVYLVLSAGGGVDGMDNTDKGGTLVSASFDKAATQGKYGIDCRYKIEPQVVDVEVARNEALAKLSQLDRLVLFGEGRRPKPEHVLRREP